MQKVGFFLPFFCKLALGNIKLKMLFLLCHKLIGSFVSKPQHLFVTFNIGKNVDFVAKVVNILYCQKIFKLSGGNVPKTK